MRVGNLEGNKCYSAGGFLCNPILSGSLPNINEILFYSVLSLRLIFVNERAKEEREALLLENVALKKELADAYTRHLNTYILTFEVLYYKNITTQPNSIITGSQLQLMFVTLLTLFFFLGHYIHILNYVCSLSK